MFDLSVYRSSIRQKRKLIVVAAENEELLQAAYQAEQEGFIEPLLIGKQETIEQMFRKLKIPSLPIEDASSPQQALDMAIQKISPQNGDILMKGIVDSSIFLSTVLKKEALRCRGGFASHVAYFLLPHYSKPLIVSDSAINIAPDLEKKIKIISNAVQFAQKMGITHPQVACCSAIEKVNSAIPGTIDAALLSKMNQRKQIGEAIVDGPLSLDNAINARSLEIKGITSSLGGEADIIIAPHIEAANFLYKALAFLAGGIAASLIWGTTTPVILTSRADSQMTKYFSILVAASLNYNA